MMPRAGAVRDERLRFERLVADLCAGFVNLPASDVGAHIEGALRRITEFLDMDRGFLIEVQEGSDELPVTRRFIGDLPVLGHRLAVHQYPWYAGKVRAGETIVLGRLPDDLPADAEEARRTLAGFGIKTSVTVPVKIGGVVLGAISFCSHRFNREWPDELVQRLVVVGEIFASALERKRMDEDLSHRLAFEALLTDISSSLTNLPAEQVDASVETGLTRLVTFLEVDRASLYELSPDGREASPTHFFSSSSDPARLLRPSSRLFLTAWPRFAGASRCASPASTISPRRRRKTGAPSRLWAWGRRSSSR